MATREFAEADLKEARFLARQVGVADERIDLLLIQTRSDDTRSREEGPRTLFISAGEGTLELFLTRWLGETHAEMLRLAGTKPLVIGPEPEALAKRPGLSGWSAFRDEKFDKSRGHIAILYHPGGELPSRLAGELASASGWDSVVVVTRAGMPLPESERDLVRSLSTFVAVCKVLIIVIPGEIPNKADADQVEQYTRGKIEANGFDKGRCGGVWFWWLDGIRRHPQAVTDPGELLVRDASAAATGREMMFREGLLNFLNEVEQKAVSNTVKPQAKLTEDDLCEMEQNLIKALTGLRRKAHDEFAEAIGATDSKLRDFVIDQVVGWNRSEDLTGVWLTYVEAVRPGTKAGLAERVCQAAQVLSLDPATKTKSKTEVVEERRVKSARPMANPFKHMATDFLIRLGTAVGCGIGLWAVTPQQPLGGVLAAGAGAAGALVGFALGRPLAALIRIAFAPGEQSRTEKSSSYETTEHLNEGKVRNFAPFEHGITTWFVQHVRAERADVASRCRTLTKKLESPN